MKALEKQRLENSKKNINRAEKVKRAKILSVAEENFFSLNYGKLSKSNEPFQ
jgi:hypothetical protein